MPKWLRVGDAGVMSRTILVSITIWLATAALSMAATIPAGTALIAQTVDPVWSHDRIGTHFKAELQNVGVNGKVLLAGGTLAMGVIEQSFRKPYHGPVRVNLTAIVVQGRKIAIHTTGSYTLERFRTTSGISVSGREYAFPRGTQLRFHLARPVSW